MIHTLVSVLVAAALAQGAAPAPDPLAAANAAARAEYARAKTGLVARTTPVILVYEGDHVVLIRNGARVERRFVPASDADLKAVDHVPLGVFAALSALDDGPVPADRLKDLMGFRDAIAAARAAVDARGFAPATLERQRRILDASTAALDAVLTSREVRRADTARYARQMGPLVLANVSEAARAQLEGLHAVVSAWRREMTPDEWRALRVVVVGVHMAREGELATQYFLRALGETGEGRRVVYAEGLWEEPRALDLLGTHLLDGSVGAAFFGDDLRMHRDVLGDAARVYLDELAIEP
jgi:hypothetical protein